MRVNREANIFVWDATDDEFASQVQMMDMFFPGPMVEEGPRSIPEGGSESGRPEGAAMWLRRVSWEGNPETGVMNLYHLSRPEAATDNPGGGVELAPGGGS